MKKQEVSQRQQGLKLKAGSGNAGENGAFSPAELEAYEVAAHFGANLEKGFTKQQARRARMDAGINALRPEYDASMLSALRRQLCGVCLPLMIVSLLLCAVFAEGEEIYTPLAACVAALMFAAAALESHAAQSLNKSLRENALRSNVLRGGKCVSISAAALVPGDIIELESGSVVPADARIAESNGLAVLETPVTGVKESTLKYADYIAESEESGSYNMVYAGTIVTSGWAKAIVCRTGKNCRLYKADAAADALPASLRKPVRYCAALSASLSLFCFALVIAGLLLGRPLVDGYMAALSCVLCCTPQCVYVLGLGGFASGVRRMYKKGAVLRRGGALDTLCLTDCLMCDKDAAFPMSELRPKRVFINRSYYAVKPESRGEIGKILTYALLCSDLRRSAGSGRPGEKYIGLPADVSLARECDRIGIDIDSFRDEYFRIEAEYDKTGAIKRALYLHNDANLLIMRGKPEQILPLCAGYDAGDINNRFDEYSRRRMEEAARAMGDASQHVIAIASAVCDCDSLKNTVTAERRLVLNGFVGLYTSLELDSAGAVYRCAAGGIETVLLSSDAYVTAVSMAKNAGVISDERQVISAEELKYADRGLYIADSENYRLYLNLSEEQWLDALRIRREKGRVVAVTAEDTDSFALMREADVSFVPASSSAETVKYAADVLLYKNGLKTIESVLGVARLVHRRASLAANQFCAASSALFICFAFSLLAGTENALRLQDALLGGAVFNFAFALAAAYMPGHRKLLRDRVDYKGALAGRLFPLIYGACCGACVICVNALLLRAGVESAARAFCVLVSLTLCLFGHLLFGSEQRCLYRSSALKNYLVPLTGALAAAGAALLASLPALKVLGFAFPPYKALLAALLLPTALFALFQGALAAKELVKNRGTKAKDKAANANTKGKLKSKIETKVKAMAKAAKFKAAKPKDAENPEETKPKAKKAKEEKTKETEQTEKPEKTQ